jgi:hypothetical protein
MRRAGVIFATAVFGLGGVFAKTSAKADVFDFNFGTNASGTFTTGAAATDGYELITGLTFNIFSACVIPGPCGPVDRDVLHDVVANPDSFDPGAAFNPTTGEFNDFGTFNGSPPDDSGLVVIFGGFSRGSDRLTGEIVYSNVDDIEIDGALSITPQVGAPIPETWTWAMTLLGFAGLVGLSLGRRGHSLNSSKSEKRTGTV